MRYGGKQYYELTSGIDQYSKHSSTDQLFYPVCTVQVKAAVWTSIMDQSVAGISGMDQQVL